MIREKRGEHRQVKITKSHLGLTSLDADGIRSPSKWQFLIMFLRVEPDCLLIWMKNWIPGILLTVPPSRFQASPVGSGCESPLVLSQEGRQAQCFFKNASSLKPFFDSMGGSLLQCPLALAPFGLSSGRSPSVPRDLRHVKLYMIIMIKPNSLPYFRLQNLLTRL